MLTRWPPTTSILVVIRKIYLSQIKGNNLKNKNIFSIFITFLEATLNFKHFEIKKFEPQRSSISEGYWLWKMCLLKCIKGIVSENPLALNVLTSPKNCFKLQKSTFIVLSRYRAILSQVQFSSNAVILKTKNIFQIFCCIFGIYIKFWTLRRQKWASELKYFWRYWLRHTYLNA